MNKLNFKFLNSEELFENAEIQFNKILEEVEEVKQELESIQLDEDCECTSDNLLDELLDVIQSSITMLSGLYSPKKIEYHMLKHNEKIIEKSKKCTCGNRNGTTHIFELCRCGENYYCEDCKKEDYNGNNICFICVT